MAADAADLELWTTENCSIHRQPYLSDYYTLTRSLQHTTNSTQRQTVARNMRAAIQPLQKFTQVFQEAVIQARNRHVQHRQILVHLQSQSSHATVTMRRHEAQEIHKRAGACMQARVVS